MNTNKLQDLANEIIIPLVLAVAAFLLIGGCMYTVHTEKMAETQLQKDKLEFQAAGKLPPDGTVIHKLDDEQLNTLVSAFSK